MTTSGMGTLLQRIPVLAECGEAVPTHMEHYDGSGHPLGFRGNQIPEAARIIAVAMAQ